MKTIFGASMVLAIAVAAATNATAASNEFPHGVGLRLPSPEKLRAEIRATALARAADGTNTLTSSRFFALEKILANNARTILHCDVNSPKCDWAGANPPVFGGVRDQNYGTIKCGSCYVFGAGGVTEASWIIARYTPPTVSPPIEISEEQLMTCEGGCDGGDPFAVLGFLKTKGANAASSIPGPNYYTAKPWPGGCKINPNAPYRLLSYGYVSSDIYPSIAEIKKALVEHGPVVAAIEATGDSTHYTGLEYWSPTAAMIANGTDVYSEPTLMAAPAGYDPKNPTVVVGTTSGNHAIIITGWDDTKRDPNNANAAGAWHIRNSWSQDWGEKGYAWISNVTDPVRYHHATTNNIGYVVYYADAVPPTSANLKLMSDMLAVEKKAYSALSPKQRALLSIQLQ
jgi:hypothetical protein